MVIATGNKDWLSAKIIGLRGVFNMITNLNNRWADPPVWAVGTDVPYAPALEFGTVQQPPYPFLRPAVGHVMLTQSQQIAQESNTSEELMRRLAFAVRDQAKRNARALQTSNRSPGTHPRHPQEQSGELVESIEAYKKRG